MIEKFNQNPISEILLRLFDESLRIWGQMKGSFLIKLLLNFHQDSTSGTMSRLHLSSKSPGVLKDIEVPDGPGDGVK